MRPTFNIWVFAIITDEQEHVLLCHRHDYNIWDLPGGGLENGESPWAGVIREVKEETGLEVEVRRLIWVYSKPHKDEVVFLFACSVIGGKITLTDEAKDIQYFSPDALPKNTAPKQIERIADYFTSTTETVLKIQGGKSTKERIKEGKL